MTGERFLSSMEDALLISLGDQAAKDPSLIVLAMGNRDEALCGGFAREHPEQFIYTGLSARDTVLLAAGLSLSGRNVIVHGQSSLLVTRAFDAIRTAVAIPSLPVRFLLARSGLTGGADGTTFQILEDLALLRSLPNLSILVPSDGRLAVTLLEGASGCKGPVFFRLSSFALPEIDRPAGFDFQPGGAPVLREGDGVTLCACGTMVHEALKASNILSQQGIEAEVIDCYSVKPLPAQAITASVRRTGCCVVAEEHNVSGGLGGAVAELLCQSSPVPIKFVSVQDRFGQSGGAEELLEYYGLSFKEVLSAASQAWTMRRR
ncbi:MAG: transketolase family protein [Synergistales bacterium]